MDNPKNYRVARTTALKHGRVVFEVRVYDQSSPEAVAAVLTLHFPNRAAQEQARLQLQELLIRVDVSTAAELLAA
jgi:hypothetical protein